MEMTVKTMWNLGKILLVETKYFSNYAPWYSGKSYENRFEKATKAPTYSEVHGVIFTLSRR